MTSRNPADSLQDRLAPHAICFGCGPANDRGLRIKSFPKGDELVADWMPERHHRAFHNVLNGGICGALLDCHSNWTAAYHLMQRDGLDEIPPTVTADFHVRLKRPTPADQPLHLRGRVVELEGSRVVVEASIESGGVVTATCRGTFMAVPKDHPAYHRWGHDESE
jgi:acyl-coenzyme A thioesterase PaaI-like protein